MEAIFLLKQLMEKLAHSGGQLVVKLEKIGSEISAFGSFNYG